MIKNSHLYAELAPYATTRNVKQISSCFFFFWFSPRQDFWVAQFFVLWPFFLFHFYASPCDILIVPKFNLVWPFSWFLFLVVSCLRSQWNHQLMVLQCTIEVEELSINWRFFTRFTRVRPRHFYNSLGVTPFLFRFDFICRKEKIAQPWSVCLSFMAIFCFWHTFQRQMIRKMIENWIGLMVLFTVSFYRLSLFWPGEGDGDFLLYLCMIFLIFLWEIDGNREVIKFTKIRLISFCLSLIYFHNFEKLLTFYILRGSFFLLFFALVLFSRQEWVVVLDNLLSLLDIFLPVDDILLIFLLF